MATPESWRVVCQDPEDESGDVIVELALQNPLEPPQHRHFPNKLGQPALPQTEARSD